ncbi:lipid IV(A) 3-deoxy-D-manno-octulosonic acid transferase [Thiotrichales bacterium 19S3-7]|nr:lipid IV(A) 3-deoxy-D-manno-octulosonic acid transferase [Thiotrichales bacterium 19S3-7]MCF6801588.1 lipid IV(A) 3-deoxy-D-manno-octulosonic acid transferase [Thiotrichales bacterium 19S3-11]
MFYSLMRLLYNLLFLVILPFIFLKNLWRSRLSIGYRKRNLERLGFCPFKLEKPIWIHSVSMGETLAIAPLAKKLIAHYPNSQFLITTMSVTGSEQVKKIYQDYPQVKHCYLPYDISILLRIFLTRINPSCLIIMETELWPNLLYLCDKRKIPVMLTNARLSEKSANGYRKIASLTKIMLNQLSLIAVQNQSDGQRFLALGLNKHKLQVTGSLKYDIQISQEVHSQGISLKNTFGQRPVWITASTHPGEDEIIIEAHKKILTQIPNALLIHVPRHPERFDSVYELLTTSFKTTRRSIGESVSEKTQAYLGDTMGEMMCLFTASDLAFIGGSLIKRGGHNTLEPAAIALPVLSGPYTFNFAEITKTLIDADALILVNDCQSLADYVIKLFNDQSLRKQLGNNAFQVVKSNQGALQKQFDLACQLINR